VVRRILTGRTGVRRCLDWKGRQRGIRTKPACDEPVAADRGGPDRARHGRRADGRAGGDGHRGNPHL